MKVSIILLNYNGKKFNIPCIDSILKQSHQDFEIIFVDNVSTDGSLEEVKKRYQKEIQSKKIVIVENSENTGFAGGNNLGVQHTDKTSKYICLLNNDTTVPTNRLEELVKGIESDKKLGAVGSLILDKGYEKEINQQIFENKKKFMLSIFGETIVESIEEGEIEKGILFTNGLSGCCFMYKQNIIKEPFEEYYFAYAEDVYLSWKIIQLGYTLGMCINSRVNHFGSGSFGKAPSRIKLFNGNKNQIVNFIIFYNIRYKILLFPLFLIKEVGHLFIGHIQLRIKAKIEGIIWIIKNWGKIQISRQKIKKNNHIGNKEFIKKMYFKVSDITYFNKQKKITRIFLKTINGIFYLYGKIVTII